MLPVPPLICVPLTVMAFQSNRHIPVQLIWLTPVVGLLAPPMQKSEVKCQNAGFTFDFCLLTSALAGVVAVLTVFSVLIDPRPRILLGPSAFGATRPDRAVAFIKANGLKGKVYTPLWWGSYVTWKLYPNVLVSVDGRNVTLFARDTVAANFRFYTEERPDLETPRGDATDYLLVPSDTPGLAALRADDYWTVLYEDHQDAVLFARTNNRELIGRRDRGELRMPSDEVPEFFR